MAFADAKKMSTLCRLEVQRVTRVSPSVLRVTFGGSDLDDLQHAGFDHWFRLYLPQEEGETSFDVPPKMDVVGYLRYLRMPGAVRPHMRSYTVRELRGAERELDVDFVVHGDEGVATRWVQRATAGDRVAIADQGRGFERLEGVTEHLLVGDETALPAVLGILRDLPRDHAGLAVIEVPDAADAQPVDAPAGFAVRFVARAPGARPGDAAISAAREWAPSDPARVGAYLAGEQHLPATLRRWLVSELGVPKRNVVFTGYWKLAKTH